jgi:hypothetical protein
VSAAKRVRVRVLPDRSITVDGRLAHHPDVVEVDAPEAEILVSEGYAELDVDVDEPVPGYDDLDLGTVMGILERCTPEAVDQIKAYERRRHNPRRPIYAYSPPEEAGRHDAAAALEELQAELAPPSRDNIEWLLKQRPKR